MMRLARGTAVALAAWGVLLAVSHVVRLSPAWPLWAVAVGIAAAAELILWLYRYESGAVAPRKARWMTGLRLAALAVLAWILIEPVRVGKIRREHRREVVVVMDDSGSMHLQDDGAEATRIAIGEAALAKSGILAKLGETLRVRTVKAARGVRAEGEAGAEGWSDSTDLAGGLATVLEQVPPDRLAGVLLVSDGRHNRPGRVEDVARRFGILDAPVGIVATGSAVPPRDAAVLAVRAPEAIHLGDRLRVAADLKFDGLSGRRARVLLRRGAAVLDEREISIPQDHHREEIDFAQVPEQGGVGDYSVEIAPLEGERFPENNRWDFETSITDARTNVLIVESYPRWEFRYLRNLFYGRDKSVALQYVLLHPDRIGGQADSGIAASAARPAAGAQAGRLPASEDEWRKFDVIIVGDVGPRDLGAAEWKTISRCVNERAALLVMIAGPRAMPHAIDAEDGRALVPAELAYGHRTYFDGGGEPFRFSLTTAGRQHPVTRQGDGETADESVWAGFPALRWRHPVTGIKDGAEVLLAADSTGGEPAATGAAGLAGALDDLANRAAREARNALLVTRRTGKGKVALLLTDRTWRLREGAGDLYHHRFWGNLVRWGAGPVLRSGGTLARLGTDQPTYTPDDRPQVTARLRDRTLQPVDDPAPRVEVLRDGKLLATVPMTPVKDSNGLYEATLDRFAGAGKYEARLRGEKADALIREDGAGELKTGFRVVGSRGPVELAETTLNSPLLETIARLSGGKVVAPPDAGSLAALFLTDKNAGEELRETSLWDSGWVLGLLAALLSAEWVIRRAGGLP